MILSLSKLLTKLAWVVHLIILVHIAGLDAESEPKISLAGAG